MSDDGEIRTIMEAYLGSQEIKLSNLSSLPDDPPALEWWVPKCDRETAARSRRIPDRHLRNVFDKPAEDCIAIRNVREFLEGDRISKTILLLLGDSGTRKSGSACWALTQKAGRFVAASEFGNLARSTVADQQELFRSFGRIPLLVFDDLGTEFFDDKGWFWTQFYSLVDHRYSNCLKTIYTANMSPAEFSKKYGDRIADRIRECGKVVTLGGVSVRREMQ